MTVDLIGIVRRLFRPHAPPPIPKLALQAPVIGLVVAFTAMPMELRWASADVVHDAFDFGLDVPDVIANIVGFIPVGVVLANHGRRRGTGIAAALSVLVETIQVFSNGRSPSLVDVATNTVGAALGIAINALWGIDRHGVTVGRRAALLSAALALMICGMLTMQITPDQVEGAVAIVMAAPPWRSLNARGAATVGRLEGFWNFDAVRGSAVSDESGSGLAGTLIHGPRLVDGVLGKGVALNGENQWVALGNPVALRLVGSLTITAWINPTSFPSDDAAIVSNHTGLGYQLDTTIDEGPRTIGFKLTNASGKLISRYGRTPLQLDRWYHIAGVYDAIAQTMDVYLNGRLDNGCLRGDVTTSQRPSGAKVFIGRRARSRGYEFAGAIDEVRIFSRPLTREEIVAQVAHGTRTLVEPEASSTGTPSIVSEKGSSNDVCGSKEPSDARVAGLVVAFGMLVAVASVGLLGRSAVGAVVASLSAGLCILPLITPLVPHYLDALVPLLASVGGVVIALSLDGAGSRGGANRRPRGMS
jgi:VanZ family protein